MVTLTFGRPKGKVMFIVFQKSFFFFRNTLNLDDYTRQTTRLNWINRPPPPPPPPLCPPPMTKHNSPFIWFCFFFITDETTCPTPDGTPVSDGSIDSPLTDTQSVNPAGSNGLNEQPRSATGAPQKRAARSLSWDAGTMTQTRLQILSCVRSVRDNIRSQISSSSPSSPVNNRSM